MSIGGIVGASVSATASILWDLAQWVNRRVPDKAFHPNPSVALLKTKLKRRGYQL